MKYYKLPESRVDVIPNIVTDRFFAAADVTGPSPMQVPYVLTAGNICQRKNQLALARAAVNTGTHLVVIGSALPGEEGYVAEFRSLAESSEYITWIPGLRSGGEELVAYYSHCQGFALPSYEETQPISLLEAIACKKTILTADRAYARQHLFRGAVSCDPGSVSSIEKGLQQLTSGSAPRENPYIGECRKEQVAASYKRVYQQLLTTN